MAKRKRVKWVWVASPILLLAGLLVVLELDSPSLPVLEGARMTDYHNRKGIARWHYESDRPCRELLLAARDDMNEPNWSYTRSSTGRSAFFVGREGDGLTIYPAGTGCNMIYARPSELMDTPRLWLWYATHPSHMFDDH